MEAILLSIGCLMILATLLPLIPKDNWWIRGFDFPRIQIIFLMLATGISYYILVHEITLTGIIILSLLVLSLFYQVYMIFPYSRFMPPQVQQSSSKKNENSFSLICSNVKMDNRHSSKLKELVSEYKPDMLLAIETDDWWHNELKELEQDYPYTVKQPQGNMYGMILYSRLELLDPNIEFRVKDDIPSIEAKIKLGAGTEVKLFCLHPRPPFPTGSDQSTERDVELLLVGKEIKKMDIPTLVLGDMNDVAWSKTNYLFQDISGLLDPRVGRGFYNTFHAENPLIRFPLDHIFHTKHFKLIDFRRLDYIGSDHFPVYIELNFEPDEKQPEPKADAKEKQEADKKIRKKV